MAKVWNQHGSDEILWSVTGVSKEAGDAGVVDWLRVNIAAVVGTADVVDWWVEDHLSRYVVVGGIPKGNWAVSGWEGVRRDNPDVAWGHRGPLVVSRVWGKLSVKLEVRDAAAVSSVVKSGVVVGARKFGAQLAIAARGRGVPRVPAPAKEGAPVGGPAAGGVKCYSCGRAGHLWRDCHAGSGSGPIRRLPFCCWGCGGVGHGISVCPGRALLVTNAVGVPAPVAGPGAAGGGVKQGVELLVESGFCSRPFGGGSVLGYLGGGAGQVAAASQGALA